MRTETLLASFVALDDVEVVAVCDLLEERIQKIVGILTGHGKPAPKTFTNYHEMSKIETTYEERAFHNLRRNGELYPTHELGPIAKILGGHDGIDSLALRAFLDAVRKGTNTPIDVYDIAAWMSVTCLSEQSIAIGSGPVAFPDFTNGKWVRREPEPKSMWALDQIYEE